MAVFIDGWLGLAEELGELGEEGVEEVGAGGVGGLGVVDGQAGMGERAEVDLAAELDGLEVGGKVGEVGAGEELVDAVERLQNGWPVYPGGEDGFGAFGPRGEEAPFGAAEGEMLFASGAKGAGVAGGFQLVEHGLDRAFEVAGLAGDFGGVAGFVGEEPGHDFGAGLQAEEAAELEEEGGGLVGPRRLAERAFAEGGPEKAPFGEVRVGLAESGSVGEERLRLAGGLIDALGEGGPLVVFGPGAEAFGDGGEHGGVGQGVLFLHAVEALQAEAAGELSEPVEHLVEEAWVVPGDFRGKQ